MNLRKVTIFTDQRYQIVFLQQNSLNIQKKMSLHGEYAHSTNPQNNPILNSVRTLKTLSER